MPLQTTTISDTLTGTDQANADLLMQHDGVVVFDAVRTAGTQTFTVQVSVDGGTTFVAAAGPDGTALSFSLASGTPHARYEVLSLAGTQWRVTTTQGADGVCSVKFGPTLAP